MNKIITDNLPVLKDICNMHHVVRLYAFGSVCTDQFNPKSDIDFLVYFKQMEYGDYADNYFHLCDELENLFKRKVDLTTDKSLSNPYFIKSVDKTKSLVYA
jgi:uncharacterized protein